MRRKFRIAIGLLAPKSSTTTPSVSPAPVHVARSVCRLIAPDEIMQFFTREQSARSKITKRSLTETFPVLTKVIVDVIMANCNVDLEHSLSALGKHLSKCSDRQKSRCYLSNMTEINRSKDKQSIESDKENSDETSSDNTLIISDSD